jgi:hypothetical protein
MQTTGKRQPMVSHRLQATIVQSLTKLIGQSQLTNMIRDFLFSNAAVQRPLLLSCRDAAFA